MRNSTKYILIVGGLILIVAFGYLWSTKNKPLEAPPTAINMESIENPVETTADLLGIYNFYSEETLAAAQEKGTPILFFRADWCPTCAAAKRDIDINYEELDESITVLEVDYDTATELKEKFGITIQHTFVQLDSQGNEVTKWVGGGVKTINDNIILE